MILTIYSIVQLILWPSLLSDTACDKLVSLLATAEKRHSGWCVIPMIRDEINMENITHKKAAMLAAGADISRKIFRIEGNLRGLLVVFHRDLTIAKNETIPESGGINELLEYIKGDPGKRTADLARGINNSTRTTERWIKLLRESGKIEFRGSKKTGGYYINQVET